MPEWAAGLISQEDIDAVAADEKLELDADRISVLQSTETIDIQACPGSGKTTLIAAKLLLLAKNWPFESQGICVLSHTNVAKDEIVARVNDSKNDAARKLLAYPHFIGTIQEFANRFIALPMVRRSGASARFLDSADGEREVLRSGVDLNSIYSKMFYSLGGTGKPWPKQQDVFDRMVTSLGGLSWFNTNRDLVYFGVHGDIKKALNKPGAKIYSKLKELKEAIEKRGCYQYGDMFVFAQELIVSNDSLASALRKRFSFLLLDEMQDTQKHQDELLSSIFPQTENEIVVQRFGDPDQAIFQGSGSEEANESFNKKSSGEIDVTINKSHRFDNALAKKIGPLSFNEVAPESELSEADSAERIEGRSTSGQFRHTLLLYDDDMRHCVVEQFGDLVAEQFAQEYRTGEKFVAKVLGAVGNEIDPENIGQLKIGHYWKAYDKAKSKKAFKPSTLFEVMRHCQVMKSMDLAEPYRVLLDGVLLLLRKANFRDEEGGYFSVTSLRSDLTIKGEWDQLRKLLYSLLVSPVGSAEDWGQAAATLKQVLQLDQINEEAVAFLEFPSPQSADEVIESAEEQPLRALPENRIRYKNEFDLCLSTIHGAKGETHDATLVVETKSYCFDLEAMLPYLLGKRPNAEFPNGSLSPRPHQNGKPNQRFMRQLYVAMSRPKFLLCLAMRSASVGAELEGALVQNGWEIRRLRSSGPAGVEAS